MPHHTTAPDPQVLASRALTLLDRLTLVSVVQLTLDRATLALAPHPALAQKQLPFGLGRIQRTADAALTWPTVTGGSA